MTNQDFPEESGIEFDINYEDLLFDLLHEAHTLSNVISKYSTIISRAVNGSKIDENAIRDHANKIVESANLLSLWLNMTELEINPGYFENQAPLPDISLYGRFHKAKINFKQVARDKKIKVSISGESEALLSMYPIIDMLPYVLLENALKYSPKEDEIEIEFNETADFIKVAVCSVGPTLRKDELDRVFEKGFRGDIAKRIVAQGSGRGLALAKQICDIHNATIHIETGSEKFTIDGVFHSNFNVVMKFPRR